MFYFPLPINTLLFCKNQQNSQPIIEIQNFLMADILKCDFLFVKPKYAIISGEKNPVKLATYCRNNNFPVADIF